MDIPFGSHNYPRPQQDNSDKPGFTAQNVTDGIEAASLVLIHQTETYLKFLAELDELDEIENN